MSARARLRDMVGRSAAGPPLRSLQRRLRQRRNARRRSARRRAALRLNARYDQWTREVIGRVVAGDSNCIDVGAHTGDLLSDMVAAAPRGNHIAVEPLPEFAAKLRAGYPAVEVVEAALSDRDGSDEFFRVTSAPGYSGLRLRPLDRPDERVERIEVSVRRLDDLAPPDRSVRLIKIDVEGGELDVLRGGLATLTRHQPYVAFEHGSPSVAAYGSTSAELFDFLVGKIGLRISLLDDWLAGRPPLSRDEFIAERNFFFLAHPKR
jgi:FkbM family methyltransferase